MLRLFMLVYTLSGVNEIVFNSVPFATHEGICTDLSLSTVKMEENQRLLSGL